MNLLHAGSMRGLPPFDALVAFEAVLRHGSMTLAAAELGVTQSAVSHRLRRLEAVVGTPLLRRLHPGLQPTAAGLALAEGFAEVLAGMASLRARCRAATGPERLQVGVGSAVAQYWLVRRLPAFMEAHPDTDVELVLLPNCDAVRAASLDVRLLWLPVTEARASSTRCLLPRETVFPVCRTDLLSREIARGDLTALLRLPLLHKGRMAGSVRDRNGLGELGSSAWDIQSLYRGDCASTISDRPSAVRWKAQALLSFALSSVRMPLRKGASAECFLLSGMCPAPRFRSQLGRRLRLATPVSVPSCAGSSKPLKRVPPPWLRSLQRGSRTRQQPNHTTSTRLS